MIRRLFLDDIRQPETCATYMPSPEMYVEENWDVVRDYKQFVNYIEENGVPDVISFDHDLADIHYDPTTWTEGFVYKEETGYDCAKWLLQYCVKNKIPVPEYHVHSMNPIGKKNIEGIFESYERFKEKVKQ
jgi:hypothetical protein